MYRYNRKIKTYIESEYGENIRYKYPSILVFHKYQATTNIEYLMFCFENIILIKYYFNLLKTKNKQNISFKIKIKNFILFEFFKKFKIAVL